MPPPRPRRFFRIRRLSDGWFYKYATQRFEERGSKLRERELLRTMRRLAQIADPKEFEVLRFDLVPYPPRPMADLLKKMNEAEGNSWRLL